MEAPPWRNDPGGPLVLGQLAAGRTVDELRKDCPYLERADVTAALEYAAAIVNEKMVG